MIRSNITTPPPTHTHTPSGTTCRCSFEREYTTGDHHSTRKPLTHLRYVNKSYWYPLQILSKKPEKHVKHKKSVQDLLKSKLLSLNVTLDL